jgi:hypothetical protein
VSGDYHVRPATIDLNKRLIVVEIGHQCVDDDDQWKHEVAKPASVISYSAH